MVHSDFICFRSLNLYWADAGTGMGRVEVVRLDGSSRRMRVWRDLDSPECLEVDMKGEKIVWSSWGLGTSHREGCHGRDHKGGAGAGGGEVHRAHHRYQQV